jgi:hypothetical protein
MISCDGLGDEAKSRMLRCQWHRGSTDQRKPVESHWIEPSRWSGGQDELPWLR